MKFYILLFATIFLVLAVPCNGQETARTERSFIEAGGSTIDAIHGRLWFARIRFGWEEVGKLKRSYSLTVKTNWQKREYFTTPMHSWDDPYLVTEIHGHMWYLGVHWEYLMLEEFISPYLSFGLIVGNYSYSANSWNIGDDAGLLLGIEPECGIHWSPVEFMHVRTGIGTLAAVAFGTFTQPKHSLKVLRLNVDLRWHL